jgi:hypothetical protein
VVVAGTREPERIELRVQMPTHAKRADHHQGMDGIARRLEDIALGEIDAAGMAVRLYLLGDPIADRRPVAVEGGDQIPVRPHRPVGTLPASAVAAALRRVLQRLEEFLPFAVHRGRIGLKSRLEVFEISGVAAVEE